MARLVVGPWVGEFGWELCCWQGYARTLARNFDEVVCISRSGHELLYDDFCDEFVPYDPENRYALNAEASGFQYDGIHSRHLTTGSHLMEPAAYRCNGFPAWAGEFLFDGKEVEQTFRRYGRYDPAKSYDLIVHMRHRDDWRNWPQENLEEVTRHFLSKGLRAACVGSLRESLPVEGCDNLRGIPLRELADTLASSQLILGCSSGVMHFASLCGCPQVVISAMGNKHRYETAWNPFGTRVLVINEEGWKATPGLVIRKAEQFLEENGGGAAGRAVSEPVAP
jgi:hypothetical protein